MKACVRGGVWEWARDLLCVVLGVGGVTVLSNKAGCGHGCGYGCVPAYESVGAL